VSINKIPNDILDQAFQWSVRLNSGNATADDHQSLEAWLAEKLIHRQAWQQVQSIEQDFSVARSVAKASTHTLETVAVKRKRKKSISALLCLTLMAGFLLSMTNLHHYWQADHITGKGEQKQLSLPGGTAVYLNSQTFIAVDQNSDTPVIHLYAGKILVDSSSAQKTYKPIVTTHDASVMPIGTRFVVHKAPEATRLSVTKGSVELTAADSSVRTVVKTGENRGVSDGQISELEDSGLTSDAWLSDIIEANNARLGDVLDSLSEYHEGVLTYDEAVADLRVTGVFRLNDTQGALTALQLTLPIEVEQYSTWWTRIKNN